jgi:3-oxoacyl-[acyl-carrier-protein] synthase-3
MQPPLELAEAARQTFFATEADVAGIDFDAPAAETAADPQRTRSAGIAGLGIALPDRVVESDSIAERLGVPSGWIERRTGITSRRRGDAGATVAALASSAALDALADAEVNPASVDLVLVATLAADEITPNAAPYVAHAIGAEHAGAIDIGAACTGFVGGLTLGAAMIEAGRAANVVVVGAELLSRFVDPDDRSTAGLFGDGAGAAVLVARDNAVVGRAVLGADGSAAPYIVAPRDTGLIRMDGHETFKRAVATLASNAAETVSANGLELEDISLFVLHQANGRILSAVAELLGVPVERVLNTIGDVGNTSAASVPLALHTARERGLLNDGDRVLLGAVGAGFTWGAVVLEWSAP